MRAQALAARAVMISAKGGIARRGRVGFVGRKRNAHFAQRKWLPQPAAMVNHINMLKINKKCSLACFKKGLVNYIIH